MCIDDAILGSVATSANLTSLHLRRCAAVTDRGIAAVAKASPGLCEIALDEVPVTETAMTHLATECPELTYLSIRGCRRIKVEAPLAAIARNSKLRHLDVADSIVGAATMLALAACCPHSLTHLDVSLCRKIPSAALGILLDACKNLETLHVYGCSQVSADVVHGHRNSLVRICGEPTYLVDVRAASPTAHPVTAAPKEELYPDVEVF